MLCNRIHMKKTRDSSQIWRLLGSNKWNFVYFYQVKAIGV